MSVIIIGGNECMEQRYRSLCEEHGCRAKVFCKFKNSMKDRIGNADLVILFTHTVSHKMIYNILGEVKKGTRVVRSHTSSMASLRKILAENA